MLLQRAEVWWRHSTSSLMVNMEVKFSGKTVHCPSSSSKHGELSFPAGSEKPVEYRLLCMWPTRRGCIYHPSPITFNYPGLQLLIFFSPLKVLAFGVGPFKGQEKTTAHYDT